MKLFLDTNIILDLLADRKPFSKWAYLIFKDRKDGKWDLYTSSFSVLTAYYLLEKQNGEKESKMDIDELLNQVEILSITKRDLKTAITTKFLDYEDGVQHECAKSSGEIDFIITRNKKDFKHSVIKVRSPEELYQGNGI